MRSPIGRLKRRQDFLRVAGGRRKWAAPGLVLQARKTHVKAEGGCAIRVGFTATRKIGGAVERNRARRRLRAAVDAVLPERAACGHDYVVIARSGTLTRPFASLMRDLETALDKLGASRAGAAPK
jgi:ribonuclease P protein component